MNGNEKRGALALFPSSSLTTLFTHPNSVVLRDWISEPWIYHLYFSFREWFTKQAEGRCKVKITLFYTKNFSLSSKILQKCRGTFGKVRWNEQKFTEIHEQSGSQFSEGKEKSTL